MCSLFNTHTFCFLMRSMAVCMFVSQPERENYHLALIHNILSINFTVSDAQFEIAVMDSLHVRCNVDFPHHTSASRVTSACEPVLSYEFKAGCCFGVGNTNSAISNVLLQLHGILTVSCHYTKIENHKSLVLTKAQVVSSVLNYTNERDFYISEI